MPLKPTRQSIKYQCTIGAISLYPSLDTFSQDQCTTASPRLTYGCQNQFLFL